MVIQRVISQQRFVEPNNSNASPASNMGRPSTSVTNSSSPNIHNQSPGHGVLVRAPIVLVQDVSGHRFQEDRENVIKPVMTLGPASSAAGTSMKGLKREPKDDLVEWVNPLAHPKTDMVNWSNPLLQPKTEIVEWPNPFNLRQANLTSFPSGKGFQRSSGQLRIDAPVSVAKSLDILRQNIQSLVNREIDAVLRKYITKFFDPAIDNIQMNLGEGSVGEEHLQGVCRQMLEDAKQQYNCNSPSRGSSPANDLSDSETGSLYEGRLGRPTVSSPALFGKRKESDTDSEASQSATGIPRKRPRLRMSFTSGRSTPSKVAVRREAPAWDPHRITCETLFVIGARANKALGFGQTRGRLYVKHPEVFRYSGDQQDKDWLTRQGLMPPTWGKVYLMVVQDIRSLAETDDYRSSPSLMLEELRGFLAPEFMLEKIRRYISAMRTDIPGYGRRGRIKPPPLEMGSDEALASPERLTATVRSALPGLDSHSDGGSDLAVSSLDKGSGEQDSPL